MPAGRTTWNTLRIRMIFSIFFSIIFFVGLIIFILWLSLRPHNPRFHVQNFNLSGLNQTNGLESAQIAFIVMVRNGNAHIGISYDSISGFLYYKDQWIGSTLILDPFYQGPENTTILYHVFYGTKLAATNNRWPEFVNDRAQGMVNFRLELKTSIQYKTTMWDTKRHGIRPKCDVVVGPDGVLLPTYDNKKCPV